MERSLRIKEIYDIEHMHDSKSNKHYDYKDKLLRNSTSSFIWKNEKLAGYLKGIEKVLTFIVDRVDLSRNFLNITVGRYYNDYNR